MINKIGLRSLVGTGGAHLLGYGLLLAWNTVAARIAGVDGYGTLTFAVTLTLVIQIIVAGGSPQAVMRYIPMLESDSRGRSVVLSWSILLPILVAVVLFAIASGIGYVSGVTPGANLRQEDWIWIVGAGGGLAIIATTASYLQAVRHPVAGTLVGTALVSLLVTIAYMTIRDEVVEAGRLFRLYAVIVLVIAGILALVYAGRMRWSTRATDALRLGDYIRFCVKALGVGIIFLVLSYMDRIMLGTMGTMEDLGLYSIPSRLVRLLYFIFNLFPPLIGPVFSRYLRSMTPNPAVSVYLTSARVIMMVSVPLSLFLLLESKTAVVLIGGAAYAPGSSVLTILAAGVLFNACAGNTTLMLQMGGRENAVLYVSVVAMVLNLAMNALLIPRCGAEGAAIGTTISLAVVTIAKILLCHRRWGCWPPFLTAYIPMTLLVVVIVAHVAVASHMKGAGIIIVTIGGLLYVLSMNPRRTIRTLLVELGAA